jgi:hypothetical protein
MGKKDKTSGEAKSGRRRRSVERQLRGAAAPLITLATGPLVVELLTGALTAGAEALVKDKPRRADPAAGKRAHDAVEAVDEAGKAADMASLLGYAVAVAAGEIAAQIIASYEREIGKGKSVQQTAKAAKKAADIAWSALGKKGR